MILLLLIAPFWVAAYVRAGWVGVAFMAAGNLLVEGMLRALDHVRDERDRAIALRRLDEWMR